MKKTISIAQLGHSVLRRQAQDIKVIDFETVTKIVEDMLNIVNVSNGVGLAAPQIYQSFRIIIIASHPSERYPLAPDMEPLVMFNPGFEACSEKIVKDWEGCLSIPGIRALVPRYENIKINYIDQQGENQQLAADGFIARVFQHEYDHLNGLVYLDRVEDNKDIISETEFQKMMDLKSN